MAAGKKKARSSGVMLERAGKRGLVYRAGLYFRGYSTTDRQNRQSAVWQVGDRW